MLGAWLCDQLLNYLAHTDKIAVFLIGIQGAGLLRAPLTASSKSISGFVVSFLSSIDDLCFESCLFYVM